MADLTFTQLLLYFSSGYIITSAFLFFFPNLIHRKRIPSHQLFADSVTKNKILKISHRGGPRYGT